MELFAIFAFIFVGIVAGLVAGLLGLSGGIITVPCLLLIFNLLDLSQVHAMHSAIGTSLAAMVLNGIAAVISHQKHKSILWEFVLSAAPGLFLGCMLGSFLAHFMSGILLQILFGMFIATIGAYVLLQKKKDRATKPLNKTFFTWIGLGIGTLASMLGVGGGVFTVPLLLSYGFAEKKAVGTSAAISLVITSLAAMAYLYFGLNEIDLPWHIGYIYLPAFAIIGLITVFFAPLGAKIANRIEGKKLRRTLAATLILIGILMIFN